MAVINLETWKAAAEAHCYGDVENLIVAAKQAATEEGVHAWHDCVGCGVPLLDVAMRWRIGIDVEPGTFVAETDEASDDWCRGCLPTACLDGNGYI
jgi:hypothetical protein